MRGRYVAGNVPAYVSRNSRWGVGGCLACLPQAGRMYEARITEGWSRESSLGDCSLLHSLKHPACQTGGLGRGNDENRGNGLFSSVSSSVFLAPLGETPIACADFVTITSSGD